MYIKVNNIVLLAILAVLLVIVFMIFSDDSDERRNEIPEYKRLEMEAASKLRKEEEARYLEAQKKQREQF